MMVSCCSLKIAVIDDHFSKPSEESDQEWFEIDGEAVKADLVKEKVARTAEQSFVLLESVLSLGSYLTYADYIIFIPFSPVNTSQIKMVGCACQALLSGLKISSDIIVMTNSKKRGLERTKSLAHLTKHLAFFAVSAADALRSFAPKTVSEWDKEMSYANLISKGSQITGFIFKKFW